MRASGEHTFAAMLNCGKGSDALFPKAAGEFVGECLVGDGDELGMVEFDLLQEFVEIRAGSEGEDFEAIRLCLNDCQSLSAYRASGTEDGEMFQWQSSILILVETQG